MHGHGENEPLPVVSYRVVDPGALVPAAAGDKLVEQHFGFNSGKPWSLAQGNGASGSTSTSSEDARYIRWLQPIEADLAKQVEYDMDDQDKFWLDIANDARRREGIAPVSYDTFEIIMDRVEKEWFDLNKLIPKPAHALPSEDSKCAICDDGECESSNAIVFCDGCNLAVHQDCYGVPYIPEGQWLCRKCTVSPDKPVSCVLCPNSYGAFKQTTQAQWAHLLCAIWVPDTGVSNTVYMEPIDGVENISKNRWKLVCYVCKRRQGACIQCANKHCFLAFHVTCAREHNFDLKMKAGLERGELRAYCEKHSEGYVAGVGLPGAPPLALKQKNSKNPATTLTLTHVASGTTSSKQARAYKQTYSGGAPVIPQYIFQRVLDYTARIKLPRKQHFLSMLCRYWSLKREARRGAPLLKRIHLEPWTASATSRQRTEDEAAKRLELMSALRQDLEKVRMLAELVRKREKKKLERATHIKKVVETYLFPIEQLMRDALRQILALDKTGIFAQPVNKALVPDYYDIIKQPMDLQTMGEKVERHEYLTVTDFTDDLDLLINNAMRYNKQDSLVFKAAVRVRTASGPIIAELEPLARVRSQESVLQDATAALLTEPTVNELLAYDYDPPVVEKPASSPPPSPKPTQTPKGKGKKRSADVAQLDSEPRPSSRAPRAAAVAGEARRTSMAPLPKSASTSSTRPHPREVARLRQEAQAASGSPVASTSKAAEEGMDLDASASSGRRRSSVAAQKAREMEAEDITNRDTFKLFESGWILPEGSRRRQSSAAPPRPASTATPSSKSQRAVDKGKQTKKEDEDVATEAMGTARASGSSKPAEEQLEELNTIAEAAVKVPAEPDHQASPSKLHAAKTIAMQLREFESKLREISKAVELPARGNVEDGTLVWAKLPGFPEFPAEVCDPDDAGTPQHLKDQRPAGIDAVLVMWFDSERTCTWLPRNKLRLLGEKTELDDLLRSRVAVLRSRKDRKMDHARVTQLLSDINEAYEWATSQAEIVDEGEPSTSEGGRRKARSRRKKKA